MRFNKHAAGDCFFMLTILVVFFGINLLLQETFQTRTMVPMIFVLGVFLVSWKTQGYFWGITASLISVLAVNYAFTYPYWAFDLISPECISSAVVMLIVAIMTGALTTRLKQQEKLKAEAEKERMRGNLLRAVSHDLRTPLTSIYGACSAMIENYDEISPERHRKMLGDVRNDAQWLVRMVENLLSVTRIDGDKVRLAKHDTVLEELIDAVLVKFRKHYPGQQVRGNRAFFSVADDGCGLPPERIEGLFTGMLNSEAPRDTGRSNMGIGLSVCSAIVKAHGSEIRGSNRPEGGAEFTFSLEMEENDHG